VKNIKAADWASHIVGFGLVSAGAAAFILTSALAECKPKSKKWRRLLEDLIMIVEAAGLSGILYQVAAIATGRPRPYVHFGTAPHHRPWDNISFFSGHVTYSFAVSAAATTVLWLRQSKLTPAALSVGLALSMANGYLRIAADKHYFTDVLVGAAVGTLVGWAVPWLASKIARPPKIGFMMGKKRALLSVGRDF
jgi:membrane-associated phospholipid phosphatase